MIESIAIAVVVGLIVGLLCIGVGRLLKSVNVPPLAALGTFLDDYGWAIGLVAALWAFVTGWRP